MPIQIFSHDMYAIARKLNLVVICLECSMNSWSTISAWIFAATGNTIFVLGIRLVQLVESELQGCPDMSPGPVQPDNGAIRGVGQKSVPLPMMSIWLK